MIRNQQIHKVAQGLLVAALLIPTAYAEDLFTVYQHAKESDPQISAAESGYLSTLEKRPQALANFKPKVTLTTTASYRVSKSSNFAGNDESAVASAGYQLQLSKPLYRQQINEQIAQTDIVIAQAEESLLAEQQNLILRVTEAYFNYLTARDGAEFARSESSAVERQYKQVKAYFEAGRSAITDVKESQARYDESVANVVITDQNVDIALESLHALTGRYYKVLRGATRQTPLVVPSPNDIKAWSTAASQNNKQVKVADYAVKVAQKSVDIARAAKKPTLDLFANHNGNITQGENQSDMESGDATIGIQFNLSLYDAGKMDSSIREARYSFHKAMHQLEAQKRAAVQQARTYYLNIVTGLSQVKALKRSLESSQIANKATQEGFRVGTRTAVDVLLALRDSYRAQKNYSSARYAFLLNTIRLKQAAGTLSESDLQALSRILSHSRSTRQPPVKPAK